MEKEITAVWAFISVDDSNNEAIVGIETPNGNWPMFSCDETRLEAMKPIAKFAAEQSKQRVKLVRFKVREELESYN